MIAACSAGALAAPSPGLAVAMRTLTGIGTAIAFVCGSDYIRASGGSLAAQGVFGAAGIGGGGLALAIVPQLEPSLGWRAAYWSAIAVALLGTSRCSRGRPTRVTRCRSGTRPPAASGATRGSSASGSSTPPRSGSASCSATGW